MKLTRKEIKECLSTNGLLLQSVLTTDQYDQLIKMIDTMSDSELNAFISMAMGHAPKSETDAIRAAKEIARLNTELTPENSAINKYGHIKFLNDDENKLLLSKIKESKPSDLICIDSKADSKFKSLAKDSFRSSDSGKISIPSDIFFSTIIPLMEFHLHINDISFDGEVCDTRIVVFNDIYRLSNIDDDEEVDVGAIIITMFGGGDIILPLTVKKGVDFMLAKFELGYNNIPKSARNMYQANMPAYIVINAICEYLLTWYGIQIALLHPDMKEILSLGRPVSFHGSSSKRGKKKVRYIRKHIITVDDIEAKMRVAEEVAGITRHTSAWYVMGHWRTCKSGKKTFIKGYWKGPNRNQKESPEELREREVIIPSDIAQ